MSVSLPRLREWRLLKAMADMGDSDPTVWEMAEAAEMSVADVAVIMARLEADRLATFEPDVRVLPLGRIVLAVCNREGLFDAS